MDTHVLDPHLSQDPKWCHDFYFLSLFMCENKTGSGWRSNDFIRLQTTYYIYYLCAFRGVVETELKGQTPCRKNDNVNLSHCYQHQHWQKYSPKYYRPLTDVCTHYSILFQLFISYMVYDRTHWPWLNIWTFSPCSLPKRRFVGWSLPNKVIPDQCSLDWIRTDLAARRGCRTLRNWDWSGCVEHSIGKTTLVD